VFTRRNCRHNCRHDLLREKLFKRRLNSSCNSSCASCNTQFYCRRRRHCILRQSVQWPVAVLRTIQWTFTFHKNTEMSKKILKFRNASLRQFWKEIDATGSTLAKSFMCLLGHCVHRSQYISLLFCYLILNS